MNSLSWFIYFVQVCDNLGSMFVGAGIVAVMSPLVYLTYTGMRASHVYMSTTCVGGADKDAREKVWRDYRPVSKYWVVAGVCMWLFAALLPSRQTLLLIAGSEIGQMVATSDAVKGVVDPGVDLLKSWIKNETDKIKNKKAS